MINGLMAHVRQTKTYSRTVMTVVCTAVRITFETFRTSKRAPRRKRELQTEFYNENLIF